ncbi:cupin domain-containing protein [Eubacteriales bacterium OttesenSCG-928-N13]|nr:cupin domain-containing protein [Eubacteriales bacterium OttesenSCG-928-N13]
MIYRNDAHEDTFRENMRDGEGTVKLTALTQELPSNLRLFSLLTFPVSGSIGYHMHENETEIYYILSGKARVSDDGEMFDLLPGDTMTTANGHSHSVTNTGDCEMKMLACIVKD